MDIISIMKSIRQNQGGLSTGNLSSSASSTTTLKDVIDGKSKDHETWINTFLGEMREGKSARSSSTYGYSRRSSQGDLSDEMSRKKKTAISDLQYHLNQEMPEMNDEQKKHFYDTALTKIFALMNNKNQGDTADIKAGISLMCILLDASMLEKIKPTICPPFANHLRKVVEKLNTHDLELFDLIACALGKISLNSGSSTLNFVEFEIDRAIELISNEQNGISKRHSAILNLRELATVTPSFFFSKVMTFFESIFIAINEPKLRQPAISCLRSALFVVVERERLASMSIHGTDTSAASKTSRIDQQIPKCFEICYDEVIRGFIYEKELEVSYSSLYSSSSSKHQAKDRDDKIHASLLILNELFRCSHDSSVILRDSISRELDFLYINQQDFNESNSFYLNNYLFNHFDYSILTSSASNQPSNMTNSELSSTVLSSMSTAATASTVSATYRSNSYLTKILRNSNLDSTSNVPIYGQRDLHSIVNYHKEAGIAPILSFFKKSKPSTLSASCRHLITSNFSTICEYIIRHLHSKNSNQVNQVLLLILPSLISFDSVKFCAHQTYVTNSINYLLNCVKNNTIKSLAFISLGLFTLAIKDDNPESQNSLTNQALDQHLPSIIQQIQQAFPSIKDGQIQHPPNSKKRSTLMPDPAVFTCLAFLSKAVEYKVKADIWDLLPSMFALGLTEPLANSLYDICKYIPELKNDIHEGLLRMLSQIIMNKRLELLKALSDNPLIAQVAYPPNETFDLATVRLALKVLGRFDFQPQYLVHFVRHCADIYLNHENREIRLEAVHTCCHLLKPFLRPVRHEPRNTIERITKDVLTKLIIVGITDIDKYVRYSVLSRLDEQFDYYLAQAENLEKLMICLNDEVFEIRELGICIMGRLCSLNPAYVMPFLRKVLLQLLTELENSGASKNMEQSARMLGHLLAATPRLIRPYTEPILKVFLPKLTDPSQAVTTAIMSAIGEQAIVSGLEMRAWFYELFPIILDAIQDTSSFQKREIALWTMGRLIENCGYVIEPYWKYPNLLEILFSLLKSDTTKQSQLIRRETIRVLGLLGAVDPYRHKIHLGVIDLSGESLISCDPAEESALKIDEILLTVTKNFDDYYSSMAINSLMKVMKDPSASSQHTMAVQAVAFIFNVLKLRSVPYIPYILPPFINIIRTGELRVKEFLLQQLGQIIGIVKKHIRPYLDDIFKVLRELWNTNETMQLTLFGVVEQIVVALGGEFRNYVPHLIPHILKVLSHEGGSNKNVMLKLFGALQNFGTNLEDYLHMLIPEIVKQFESTSKKDSKVHIAALQTIDILCDDLLLTEYSSRIIHGIARTIDYNANDKKLVTVAMDALIRLAFQMGTRYQVYIPLVNKVLVKHQLVHVNYESLVKKIKDGIDIEEEDVDNFLSTAVGNRKAKMREEREKREQQSPTTSDSKRTTVTLDEIRRAWLQYPRRLSTEDWLEWLRKFNIDLIKESPALSLRSCYHIAKACNTVARDLFNPAFLSCWNELNYEQQKELVNSIQEALKEQEIPEVTGILLNLVEFLEHIDQGPLLFDISLLAERAMKCRAYAKALHYKEMEFVKKGATTEVLGALINNSLQQSQAAYGALQLAIKSSRMNDSEVKEKWFEKLNNWESAFIVHRLKFEKNSRDIKAIHGQMRCLEMLSEWDKLYQLATDTFPKADEPNKQRMARMAVNATWNLNKWDEMEDFTGYISRDSSDSAFFNAVIKVHEEQFADAQYLIDKARQLIDTELTTMAGESYNRAYPVMLQAQLMSELEEVIHYKLAPEAREMIKQKWWRRLQGCQGQVEDWKKILQVRSLVLSPQEDMRSWLQFAKLCDRNHRCDLSFKTIVSLMGLPPSKLFRRRQPLPMTYPEVTLKFINHIWFAGNFKRSFIELNRLITSLENPSSLHGATLAYYTAPTTSPVTPTPELVLSKQTPVAINKLLSRAYLKMAECQEFLVGFSEQSIPTILDYYQKATERDKHWYKAWHSWAFMNFRALKYCKEKQSELMKNLELPLKGGGRRREAMNPKMFCIQAVQGFFRSVTLSQQSMQDTLRILTLWFEDGYDDQVRTALEEGIKNVSIETWLQVIPQLIARIDAPHHSVAKLIHQLLTDIGKYHPQALIYPLTVASKSTAQSRSHAARNILQLMQVHSPNLVKQAILVSEELIRIAILWHELWHEGLEDASRLYFGDKNIESMFETLEPLHQMIERTPLTFTEHTFYQNYGADLGKAYSYCKKYKHNQDPKNLNLAWEIYYHVFRRISRQLPQLTSLELQYVSPKLTECTDLELAIPGSYNPKQELICISRVKPQLNIITSKQRPRKLTIKGSNGRNYMFLLKGHEDLRQDERVMQLFGLVNTLLNSEISTSKQNLAIQRYAVIPLSPNSGLIGWVPHCDTLNALIRDYRDKRNVLFSIEHQLMLRMAPDYDRLTVMQKVEVFEHALENTTGDDLAKILWLKSPSSEVWFDRRTNYTRSLAVMSMVGYILGLGDRHPSNLMLDRMSGKILHIDFGDCFEVAMTRGKYPEKIPFRLTRMLINAMEVTGLDGTFTITCQSVMVVMRKHKESLMALLEAFVYDPLLNWRLFEGTELEGLNSKAVAVITRVRDKLTGRDFDTQTKPLGVLLQVDRLIKQATSHENLCQCYIGWCPFW